MLNRSSLTQKLVIFTALLSIGLVFHQQVKEPQRLFQLNSHLWVSEKKVNIANLADGSYQFCSQPDPQDWRDGAGVCANFHKTAHHFNGYYGYPHSDNFICIRGNIKGNLIVGEALSILWADEQQNNISTSAFKWDSEERLTLSQGNLISTANHADAVQWIIYRQALLNLEGFYQYNRPRMTPVSQLCHWK
ncbi:conserved hypothetical protein [Trichormus variabilis ATCC 29413]|uniref:Uncharacterized protein n=2 Tax=Anabaena variabilis TaxID=264691 RepID=Q3M6P3_TRIV2|nr:MULTISPECIES: hypothetical protein [Nostocaceae]ABA23343.1 conserved hypothetical protein [Trichormus variabilis ATCC 29413]MBC1214313.1 hypothetical protein [Trichormus variabilis ARAD]MBC1254452.1 hypothetical protein [Trichormus variabilis V5]MBC1268036.1 hypothetical protein [Trichormus variabilis FSR]MBC1302888.1 hypothetical protein [Trichormus variabilis N2B]